MVGSGGIISKIHSNQSYLRNANCAAFFGNDSFHLQMTFGQQPIKDSDIISEVNVQQMAL
jgi:hypothetical protein